MLFPKKMPPSIGGIPWLGRAIEFGSRPIELFLENKKKVNSQSFPLFFFYIDLIFFPFQICNPVWRTLHNTNLWRKHGDAFW